MKLVEENLKRLLSRTVLRLITAGVYCFFFSDLIIQLEILYHESKHVRFSFVLSPVSNMVGILKQSGIFYNRVLRHSYNCHI